MMAAWMLYFIVISLLLSTAAAMAERALTPRKQARRWLWAAALVLSVMLPPAMQAISEGDSPQRAIVALADAAPPVAGSFVSESPIEWVRSSPVTQASNDWDRWLVTAWIVATALLFAVYALGWMQMRRRLRESTTVVIDGTTATVADDVGPAVIGFLRPRIVVPRWLLDGDASTRAIALAHEREHLAAHDAQLFGAALVLITLLPWNLPLWWQLRRLRFAIEVDCDARVLRAGGDPVAYGNVLLDVASRLSAAPMPGVALSESGSLLEKRIRLMKRAANERWRIVPVVLGSCAFALVAAAATVTPPAGNATFVGDEAGGSGSIRLPSPVSEQQSSDRQVAAAVAHFYPQLAQKQQSAPRVWLAINRAGEITAKDLELHPLWSERSVSEADWSEHLRRFGIAETQATHRISIETRVGPNTVDVLWVTQPDAIALDSSAPRIIDIPPGASRSTQDLLTATAAQRAAIAQYDAEALAAGLPLGQELWFLVGADGSVLRAGRRHALADPQAARADLQAKFPGVRVAYVTRGTAVKDGNGRRIPVSWQWLEQGSPLP